MMIKNLIETATAALTNAMSYIDHNSETAAAPRLKSKRLKNGKLRPKTHRGEKFHDPDHNYYRKDGSLKLINNGWLWDGMTPAMKKAYVKQYPTSGYAKDLKEETTKHPAKKSFNKNIDDATALKVFKLDDPRKEKELLKAMPVHTDVIQKAAMSASVYNMENLKKPNKASISRYLKGMSNDVSEDPEEVLTSLKVVFRKHKSVFSAKDIATLKAIRDEAKYG